MTNLLCRICGTEIVDGCSCGEGTMELVKMLTALSKDVYEAAVAPEEPRYDDPSIADVPSWLKSYEDLEGADAPAEEPEAPPTECWGYGLREDGDYTLGCATREDAIARGREAMPDEFFYVAHGQIHPPSTYLPPAELIVEKMAERAKEMVDRVPDGWPDATIGVITELDEVLRSWADSAGLGALWQIDQPPEWIDRPAPIPPLYTEAEREAMARWRAAPDARPGDPAPVFEAAVSHVERGDGKLLVVWNRRYAGWAMPGGKVEDGETVVDAQRRELYEETGLRSLKSTHVYEGDTAVKVGPDRGRRVHVFRVVPDTYGPREMEPGAIVGWMSREDFLRWSPFREFYEPYFAQLEPS